MQSFSIRHKLQRDGFPLLVRFFLRGRMGPEHLIREIGVKSSGPLPHEHDHTEPTRHAAICA